MSTSPQQIGRRWLLSIVLMIGAVPLWAAEPAAPALRQSRQLLDWLGALALLEQAPLALAAGVEAEAKFREASAQQATAWRKQLEPALEPKKLQDQLVRYVAQRYAADRFAHIEELLQQPLPKRVRFFELAMARPAAANGLREFREQLQREPQPQRRELARSLDNIANTSLLAASLQTYIGDSVRRVAGAPATDAALLAAELTERQHYLAPFTEDYLLYAYRYLRDDELTAYRDLLGDTQVQWLLEIVRQGVADTLQKRG